MNGLNPVDHFLLARNQRNHEQWLEQTVFQTRELQQQLAEQAAANQGHLAIVKALVAAYNANDWQTIQAILGDYNARNQVYQAAYYPTYNTFRPV
jgi:hydroxymethylglutaryl-CoA reductase